MSVLRFWLEHMLALKTIIGLLVGGAWLLADAVADHAATRG
jgi:hypothetical protein